MSYNPDFTFEDFRLIAYGRHFRVSPRFKLIIGRDEQENALLARCFTEGDIRFEMADCLGPLALVRGAADEDTLRQCAAIVARYSRGKTLTQVRVKVTQDGKEEIITVAPAQTEYCDSIRL